MSMESLSSVAFKDQVDVVVSCLASRTGRRGGAPRLVAMAVPAASPSRQPHGQCGPQLAAPSSHSACTLARGGA